MMVGWEGGGEKLNTERHRMNRGREEGSYKGEVNVCQQC